MAQSDPANQPADLQAAMRTHRAGQLDQAEQLYQQVLRANPAHHGAMVMLAQVLLAKRQTKRSIELIEQALTLTPDHGGYLFQLASAQMAGSRVAAAHTSIQRSVQLDPNQAQSQSLLGVVLDRMNRADPAQAAHARSRSLLAGHGPQLKALAATLHQAGSIQAARDALVQAGELLPQDAELFLRLGEIEQQLLNADSAIIATQRALKLSPGHTGIRVRLAAILEHANQLDEAARHTQAVLTQLPGHVAAATLALRIARRQGDPRAAAERLAAMVDASPNRDASFAAASVELGHALDALGRYDEAFARFSAGKSIWASSPRAKQFPLNVMLDGVRTNVEQARRMPIESWTLPNTDDRRDAPIFFMGFPRSGTTLTERILDAHPRLVGTDEAMLLSKLFIAARERVGGDDPYTVRLDRLTDAHVIELRAQYRRDAERALGAERVAGRRIIDKLPLNVHRLGLVRRVFPDAKVLFGLRDPRDCCLSCFMQDFEPNAAMVHFCSIKTTAILYDATLEAWTQLRDHLGLDWFETRYEDLVSDMEGSARGLIEFLDEEWTDEVLAFQQRTPARALSTPSYAAVTQKITTRAVGRWSRYESHLGPMLEILAPWVDRLGYAH